MKSTLYAILKIILLLIYITVCISLFLLITFYDPAKNYLLNIFEFFTNMGFIGYVLIVIFGII